MQNIVQIFYIKTENRTTKFKSSVQNCPIALHLTLSKNRSLLVSVALLSSSSPSSIILFQF